MKPWLSVVGIGEDGIEGLSSRARQLISTAELVFGGARHLTLAGNLITGQPQPWLSPFEHSIAAIRDARLKRVCVLASGDPMHFGVGATLARHFDPDEMTIMPAPSSFSLAAAALAWPLQDTECISLHGRSLDLIRPALQPGRRILALTSDESDPAKLAKLLHDLGFGQSEFTVLEALGGFAVRITRQRASVFNLTEIKPLNVCAIEVDRAPNARILPLTTGLDDTLFAHDGQISKREIRALTLAALAPRRGELLWDVGAGSGSVAVEWLLADPAQRAIAIEADGTRAERIAGNARNLGVPGLSIVTGKAPDALAGLQMPDAIFVGGGGSDPGVMDTVITALRPGGRIVANAVTTQMESVLLDLYSRLGGTLTRLDIARAAPIGEMTGWRPAMPVTQWAWTKPEAAT